MQIPNGARRTPGRLLAELVCFVALLGACVAVARPSAAGAEGGGSLMVEPVLPAAAAGARQLFGPSPKEAPGEVWGVGEAASERIHIIRYTDQSGWEAVPDPVEEGGGTVSLPAGGIPFMASAGRTTPAGGIVTAVALPSAEGVRPPEDLIVRDPGGPLRAIPAPPPGDEHEEEQLFRSGEHPQIKIAAVEEPSGRTGAFDVPDPGVNVNQAVLHYDGSEWRREKICLTPAPSCTVPQGGFAVLAIGTAGAGQEWMLARRLGQTVKLKAPEGIVLLRREEGVWRKQVLGGPLGEIFAKRESVVAGANATITAREEGQPLTVTSKGVWVDATVSIGGREADATIYYDVGPGDPGQGTVTGSWCDPPESTPAWQQICRFPLGSDLPAGDGRSFAWPGSGAEGHFGTRAITGVGQGAMLIFEHGAFSRVPLGGNGGAREGAALVSPEPHTQTTESLDELAGWLGPSYRLTREPVPSGLQAWPVPFRRPLLSVVPQPGAAVGDLSSQALAVGAGGEVARYLPGVGWQPESLLTGSGTRAAPNLRGVAWPQPGFAYAVGDEGAMWLWRATTGLWEPDPGAPPNLIRGNFTGIAFDPNEPERGYAVGKQGLLLSYGRRWTQDRLPDGLNPEANITSIAFAGKEALATWTLAVRRDSNSDEPKYIGGLIVNDGSGWELEEGAGAVLGEVETGLQGYAPRRVAALPDGGAVVAGIRGGMIEREAAGAPWHAVPGPLLGYPSALAAIREGGQVRALISVGQSTTAERESDRAQAFGQPASGQAALLTGPYPLPVGGVLARQTANGWRDEQRLAYPRPSAQTNQKIATPSFDLPREPDPLLGILVSPDGSQGWVVGGQTGEEAEKQFGSYLGEGLQTATVMRYGPSAAPPSNFSSVPIQLPSGEATLAAGGGAQCEGSCADLVKTGIGPDVWLRAAVARAASIPGLRAFLYTGSSVSENLDLSKVSRNEFASEEGAYANRLGSEAGALPVFAAPSESDRYESSLATFGSKFSGFPAPLGSASAAGIVPIDGGDRGNGNYSYSFDSLGAGGEVVRVIVLDDSVAPVPHGNLCWLGGQLARAKAEARPAIVVGNREVGGEDELRQLLVTGSSPACPGEPAGASVYVFKAEGNSRSTLSAGSASIPAFGTGTLGYLDIPEPLRQQFLPASGFLLISVDASARSPATNVAPVSPPRLIPSIGSLAIDALDGTLLRRSQVALFRALARRPIAGRAAGGLDKPDPYIQIPTRCVGRGYRGGSCGAEILPEYSFTSSRPDIANFVKVDPVSSNPRAIFLNSAGKPVADPSSGLLCAFNSGTTVVSVETGGLSYSVPVTVQKGSVQRPCGTVPRTDLPVPPPKPPPPPPPPPPTPSFQSPPSTLPPPPTPVPAPSPGLTPAVAPPVPKPPVPKPPLPPFIPPAPGLTPVPVIVPPPPPPAAEPTPPSGTSPVTQPATSPEEEEEEEAAFEDAHSMVAVRPLVPAPIAPSAFVQKRHSGSRGLIYGLPALAAIVALAGAGISRRRRDPEFAFEKSPPRRRRYR